MRRVEVRRVSNGAVVVYESDRHPRTESVYTAIDLALEAASAWLSGEMEVTREHGRSVTLADPLGGERRKPGVIGTPERDPFETWSEDRHRTGRIGTPWDPPETPVEHVRRTTAWERDE